ncbi:uncharacterized protein LOC106129968 [Amyelois transitella]|uniref:uncharacterized protein LOC106129968 n=1 Tax=Amyelois transitella TaxID=680683 RepID=UPI002990303E|nr:uncharacterized protein LOC106129968 [Amyelois transitella]
MSYIHPTDLIEEVKKRPGLYNTDQQPDREEKLAMWKEIGTAIYQDWDSLNKASAYDRVLQLQRKWRSLRDAYNRELRARRTGIRVNRRVYKYFKKMSFLGGFTGNLSEEDETNDNQRDFEDDHAHSDDQDIVDKKKKIKVEKTRKKKRTRRPSVQIPPPEELEIPMFPVEVNNDDSDSDKLFLLSFLPEMRQLPLNIKMWVRAQVANVMQEAVACHYNNTQPGTAERNGLDGLRHDSD